MEPLFVGYAAISTVAIPTELAGTRSFGDRLVFLVTAVYTAEFIWCRIS